MREAPGAHDPTKLPPDLPIPVDDGAARHLTGASLPDITLPGTTGPAVTLSKLQGVTVLYIYPRTGVPGIDAPPGWDDIPGARGCTPQSCGFRDHFADRARPANSLFAPRFAPRLAPTFAPSSAPAARLLFLTHQASTLTLP